MSIGIFRSRAENFPEKIAICGGGVLPRNLLMGARRKRTEWVYDNLRTGIIINTAIDHGEVVGQVTALPLEHSPVELSGDGFWYIPCVWMVPKSASPLLGERLIGSIVEDLEGKVPGIVTLSSELWMNHRSFLERFGFVEVAKLRRVSNEVDVMALRFDGDAPALRIIERNPPAGAAPRLDMFYSSHCPVHVATAYRLSKEQRLLAKRIQLVVHNTSDRAIIERHGYSFALILNGETDLLRQYLLGRPLEELLREYL